MSKKRTGVKRLHNPFQWKIALVMIFLACLVGLSQITNQFFRVTQIECYFVSGEPCSTEISTAFLPLLDRSIFFLDMESFVASQVNHILPVSLINYQKYLPQRLTVTLEPEAQAYQLVWSTKNQVPTNSLDQSERLIVSRSGLVFKFDLPKDVHLPIVFLPISQANKQQ